MQVSQIYSSRRSPLARWFHGFQGVPFSRGVEQVASKSKPNEARTTIVKVEKQFVLTTPSLASSRPPAQLNTGASGPNLGRWLS